MQKRLGKLMNRLNRMYRSRGSDIRAKFMGSQMNHDMPITWSLIFSRELNQTEMTRTEKLVKRALKSKWWEMDNQYLNTSDCSRQVFNQTCVNLQIVAMHSTALDALENLENWVQEIQFADIEEAKENMDSIKDWMDASIRTIGELSK